MTINKKINKVLNKIIIKINKIQKIFYIMKTKH